MTSKHFEINIIQMPKNMEDKSSSSKRLPKKREKSSTKSDGYSNSKPSGSRPTVPAGARNTGPGPRNIDIRDLKKISLSRGNSGTGSSSQEHSAGRIIEGRSPRIQTASDKPKSSHSIASSDTPKTMAAEAALSRLDKARSFGFAKETDKDVPEDQLAVKSVRFLCPAVSDEILPAALWKPKITQYLSDLSRTDPGLAAVLKIRTLNPNLEAVNECVQILSTYLKNILMNPVERKYRTIKLSNKIFIDKVQPLVGALELLYAAGFISSVTTDSNPKLTEALEMPDDIDVENLEIIIDALCTSEPLVPEVYRDPLVLQPQDANDKVYLPDDFYDLTAQELKSMYKKSIQKQQEEEPLMTKAMRAKQDVDYLAKYKFSLLRIRFPDATFLQGTFARYDTQKSIREFIDSCLIEPLIYSLYCPHLKTTLSEKDDFKTLKDLKLIPSVVLHLIPADAKKFPKVYLRPVLFQKIKKI